MDRVDLVLASAPVGKLLRVGFPDYGIRRLNFTERVLPLAGDHGDGVPRQRAPALLRGALELRPVGFDASVVHGTESGRSRRPRRCATTLRPLRGLYVLYRTERIGFLPVA